MIYLTVPFVSLLLKTKQHNNNNENNETTYQRVHTEDLFVLFVLEEEAIRVLINHLKVRARVGGGHLCCPVVVAVEKWYQTLLADCGKAAFEA